MSQSTQPPSRGLPDALREAIESTLSSIGEAGGSTAAGLEGTLDRAGELLDEVARRGREVQAEIVARGEETGEELRRRGAEAGAELARRGQQAAEVPAVLTARVLEAVRDTLDRGRADGGQNSQPKPEG
jgi:hypothetical protein